MLCDGSVVPNGKEFKKRRYRAETTYESIAAQRDT